MYIIADSGSTKTEWSIINTSGCRQIVTSGINPIYLSNQDITSLLKREIPFHDSVDNIYFYGAGCAFEARNSEISSVLKHHFHATNVYVHNDLLGAARALCGKKEGIACILGTGSNSCYYDGNSIVSNVHPLGYILGDEASGAALGKQLIADILKGILSKKVCDLFYQEHNLSYSDIIENIYRKPLANRFLASFAPFLGKYMKFPELDTIISNEMDKFIERNIMQYPEVNLLPISFTGSIAWHFQSPLKRAIDRHNLHIGTITSKPMDGLIEFHKINSQLKL